MKKLLALFLLIIFVFPFIASCNESDDKNNTSSDTTSDISKTDAIKGDYSNMKDIILIEMEDGGKIVLQLYPEIAPITVANFEKLVSDGFYDGLIFHRVWKDFMIQGGDPKGNGTGGSDKTIKGEFSLNGVNNTLSHTRGVISMARSDSYDSASSQFFIVHADSPHLNGQYAAFGKVLEGMDVVDKIASVKVNNAKKPLAEQKIKSITIISDISNSEDVSAESNTSDVISTENSTEDSSN
ncbi:MAG: hypothetical protein A2Y15_05845 [Clostridiales bacterium GWF2_36_10]|nr:MAG: hypothetical protein A2Y15_05845 [Clostridiales bacterium GWF2_36_10]